MHRNGIRKPPHKNKLKSGCSQRRQTIPVLVTGRSEDGEDVDDARNVVIFWITARTRSRFLKLVLVQ
jgi:hypothetical protein